MEYLNNVRTNNNMINNINSNNTMSDLELLRAVGIPMRGNRIRFDGGITIPNTGEVVTNRRQLLNRLRTLPQRGGFGFTRDDPPPPPPQANITLESIVPNVSTRGDTLVDVRASVLPNVSRALLLDEWAQFILDNTNTYPVKVRFSSPTISGASHEQIFNARDHVVNFVEALHRETEEHYGEQKDIPVGAFSNGAVIEILPMTGGATAIKEKSFTLKANTRWEMDIHSPSSRRNNCLFRTLEYAINKQLPALCEEQPFRCKDSRYRRLVGLPPDVEIPIQKAYDIFKLLQLPEPHDGFIKGCVNLKIIDEFYTGDIDTLSLIHI